jgi:hypothetical protein
MRQWVCRLQLLLALATTVIFWSKSRGNHDQILLSQIRDSSKPGGPGPCTLYPPGTEWPSFTARHWIPFSSPFTTRRATAEVFEPASTRSRNWGSHSDGYEESYLSGYKTV